MQIDWQNFTPWASLLGGLMIGIAALLLINLNGRILGASGILGGLIPPRGDAPWRLSLIAGLVAAPLALGLFGLAKAPVFNGGWMSIAAAGLLVGFGTRLGSGCTSGHGVCGIARLSPRSIAATIVFMLAGILTVYAVRHLAGG